MTRRQTAPSKEYQGRHGQEPSLGSREICFSLLLLIFVLATGCERSGKTEVTTLQKQESPRQGANEGEAHYFLARAAFSEGDYDRCESEYIASARLANSNRRARSLYGASRCAARSGRFQSSLFLLGGAASAGFGDYDQVANDPLLRPLYGHARWQLVLDVIRENFRNSI